MKKTALLFVFILAIASVCAFSGCGGGQGKSKRIDFDPFEVYSENVTEYKDMYTGSNAKTVYAARDLVNKVNVYYLTGERNALRIANGHMNLDYSIGSLGGSKRVTSITSPDGKVYVENTADAFIELKDGTLYTSANGIESPYLNSYRHGAYYYDTHILNNSFGLASEITDIYELPLTEPTIVNDVKEVKVSDGLLTVKMDRPEDPYIGWSDLDIDADRYSGLRITLKNNSTMSGEIFVVAGGFNIFMDDHKIAYTLSPDGEYHTYTISLESISGYKGVLKQLRIDFDKVTKDTVTISKIEFLARDTSRPDVLLDRNFHVFTDKINSVDRFVPSSKTEGVAAMGLLTRINKVNVEKLIVKDKNGTHDSLEGVDWESAEYVGFDIKDSGVFGYILLKGTLKTSMKVVEDGGDYLIRQEFSPKDGLLKKKNVYEIGRRFYTDTAHSFDGFLREAEFEMHPLENVETTTPGSNGRFVSYDSLKGMYVFTIESNAGGFSPPYYSTPDRHYTLSIKFTGADEDRTVYVYTHALDTGGTLECAVLLDENNVVLPIKTEVSKNFSGDGDETVFDEGDHSYSDTFFPLVVESGKETNITVVNLYQNWGKYPLKQLSSIQFFTTYYHLSTGVTETNCIAPYFVYGKDYWTIPDFRPMSAPLWASQPQHTSGGCPRVLQYTSADKGFSGLEFTTKYIDSSGPVYADVLMNYISEDNRIAASYRHVEMPQSDESRAYYDIEFKVLEDVTIENFRRDFNIFGMDGRFVFYNKLGYLDASNSPAVAETNRSADKQYYVLGNECPYVAIYDADAGDYVNMAVIVADSDVIVGGRKFTGSFVCSDFSSWNLNRINLSLDLGKVTLKAGDVMKFRLIIFPYGSQEIKDDERVRLVRENTCLNPIKITSETDAVKDDGIVPKAVSADGKTCEFTVSGGAANIPAANPNYYYSSDYNIAVRAYGFDSFGVPEIYEKVNGEWVRYEVASVNGYDGYAVYCDADNSFSYAFVVTMNEAQPRTFRIVTK